MSFLPEVKMDFIPSDDDDEKEDNITTEMEEFDEDKDITQEEIEEKKEEIIEEDIVPTAKSKREGMDVNEIFNMPIDTNVKLTKKGKPRKKRPPMSEAHKEKLKAARVKAMESRKAKAQEKKDAKALEKEEKELLKKQKVKRVKQLKEEVDEEPKPKSREADYPISTITKKDLEEAQLTAIMNYEKIRKQRKEQKKIDQEKNKEQEAIRNQIRRAVAPPQQEYNMFANCY
jgi:hypothetical protein